MNINTAVWAHRGASAYAPENTMPAFRMAADMGADGVELDVHLTADGHVVVAHDPTVDRVSEGTGAIAAMTLEQLLQLNFNKLHPEAGCSRIPLLSEVLQWASGTGLYINIEIKDRQPHPGIEAACVDIVNACNMRKRVIYSSFDHYTLMRLRDIDTSAAIGLLYSENMYQPWQYAGMLQANALHPYYLSLYNPGIVAYCRHSGVKLHPWTIDDPGVLRQACLLGVDAVITNKPDVALVVRRDALGY